MTYTLMHGPTLQKQAPYTFFLPHPWRVNALGPGDWAKLGFEYDEPGEKFSAERMWVLIDEVDDGLFRGTLDNDPSERFLKHGAAVQFGREHILDIDFADGKPEPSSASQRTYWERCLVDECVLNEDIPIEYLYREEPEIAGPEDEYPDSGWRLRGREGGDNMDDRGTAYVALGAVLNRDDSWLHLIDEPIGSAFMRNFETGEYVVSK